MNTRLRNIRKPLFRLLAFLLFLVCTATGSIASQEQEFVTVFSSGQPELDPHRALFSSEAQIHTALHEGLFTYDPSTLEPVKALAERWTRSEDGRTYRFVMRADARWSDGTPLTAEDVAQSWFRMLDLNADYATFFDIIEGAKAYRLGELRDPSAVGIRTEGNRTLVVRLARPAAYFTRLLCHQSFAPIHPSLRRQQDWYAAIPFPVNGPYRPVSYENGELILEKNQAYWDATSVEIPRLRMIFTDDDALATSLFNTGHAHWLNGPGEYDRILLESAIQVFPTYSTHYWFFNARESPWNDARVRRALALLLPWQNLRSRDIYRLPATTLVLPLPGYSKTRGIEAADRKEALRLLEEAGYPEGKGLPPMEIVYADFERPRTLAQAFREAWSRELGIEVRLKPVSMQRYMDFLTRDAKQGGFTLAHETWIGDFADPEAFLQMWAPDSPLNSAGFRDQRYQELLEKSYDAEGDRRMALLAEAETYLLQNAACLPIYHNFAASVIDTDYVLGWYQNALDIHPYKYLRFGTPSISPNVARR